MNYKTIMKSEKVHIIIFSVISFLLHLVVIHKFAGWFSTDTDGYWLHAATFLGKDWSGVARNMDYYYSWGYSVLLTIPMLLTDVATRMLKISVIMNAMFCACIVPLAYSIIRKMNQHISHKESLIGAFLVSMYSTYILEAGVSLSECLIYYMCFFIFWCFVNFVNSNKYIWGILLGCSVGYLYIIHNRTIGIVVAFVLTILFFLKKSKNIKKGLSVVLPFVLSLGLKFYVDYWLRIREATENVYTKNTYSAVLNKYSQNNTLFRFVSIIENVIGEYWYTCIGTFLIGGFGIWYLCRKILSFRKKNQNIEWKKTVLYIYVLLSWFFSVGVSALSLAKSSFVPDGRLDVFIYGRYMECTVGLLMLFGFLYLHELRQQFSKKTYIRNILPVIISIVIVSVVTYFFTLKTNPYNCNWFSIVAVLFPLNKADMKVSILLTSILLGGLGVFILYCIIRTDKRINYLGFLAMIIMFMYIGYNATNQVSRIYAEGKSLVNNPIYNEYFNDICDYIKDNNINRLYVYAQDGYEAFSYQFFNKHIVVTGVTSEEELDNIPSDEFVLMKSAEIPAGIPYEAVYSNDLYSVCLINNGGNLALSKKNNLELTTVTIDLDTVETEYQFLFLSDNQANFDDREDLGWFGSAESRVFLDDAGNSSANNFDNFISFANEADIDGVLFGGDIIDFASEKNLMILSKKLNGLKVPYIYTYGNHDSYLPWENRFNDTNQQFLNLFESKNCEFQCMEFEGVNIVSIRNYQKDGTANITEEALEQFKKVYEKDEPIVLMLHVPIYTEVSQGLVDVATDGRGDLFRSYDAGDFGTVYQSRLMGYHCGYELTEETKEFLNLIEDKNSPVCLVLAGHLHESWCGNITDTIMEYVVDGAFKNKGIILIVK